MKKIVIIFSLIISLFMLSCSTNTNQEETKLNGYITEQYDYSGTQEHLTSLKVARSYYFIIPQAPKNISLIEIILEQQEKKISLNVQSIGNNYAVFKTINPGNFSIYAIITDKKNNKTQTKSIKISIVENTFNIHYSPNGGVGSIPDQEFRGSNNYSKENSFIYENHTFICWALDINDFSRGYFYEGASLEDLSDSDKDITLYAIWGNNLSYTFNTTPRKVSNIIIFGDWPQKLKDENVIVSEHPNDRGFYIGSDNNYYEKMKITPYTGNYYTSHTAYYTDFTILEGRDIDYFKVEPLEWNIIDESDKTNVFIITKKIIMNGCYYPSDPGTRNYSQSTIRYFFNGLSIQGTFDNKYIKGYLSMSENEGKLDFTKRNFLNICFSNDSLSYMNKTEATGCFDKVFLVSRYDISPYDPGTGILSKSATDFAIAGGIWCSVSGSFAAAWFTRDIYTTDSWYLQLYDTNGKCSSKASSYGTEYGIVPAIKIKMEN